MKFGGCGFRYPLKVRFWVPFSFLLLLGFSSSTPAKDWDRAGAIKALEEARKLQIALIEQTSPPPARDQYLKCIRMYQQVYLRDPHYGGSDDAIFAAASLYQEMGEKFGDLGYYRSATKLYQFLVSDYPSSPSCPEALLRTGDLFAGPLGDEFLASIAYEQLRKDYRTSEAAAKIATRRTPPDAPKAASGGHPSEPTAVTSVQGIRHWSTDDYTRVVIDMDREARYQKTRLKDPDRIFFDIFSAKLSPDLSNKTFVVADEFLRQVRVAQNRLDVVRVVLDFTAITDYDLFELHDPFRLIIDIRGPVSTQAKRAPGNPETSAKRSEVAVASRPAPPNAIITSPAATKPEAPAADSAKMRTPGGTRSPESAKARGGEAREAAVTPAADKVPDLKKADLDRVSPAATGELAAPNRAATPTSRGDRTLTRMLGLKIGRIVLDPGHGGYDTGTIGPGGLKEKDLALQVALLLQQMLEEKLGAEVVLTRTDDSFVPLEERTAVANQHQADLFISIHGNSSHNRSISGVETYYLNFAKTEEAREVAARENATTIRNVRDLQDLVKKITQADKSTESRELASMLQKKLFVGARQVYPTARNRGVRSAPFVVLIGANMPSVLAEVGFISNPRDEKLLKSESNRQRLAEALFAGIEGYMKTLGSDVAQNQSN